jgi:hypothetical protein
MKTFKTLFALSKLTLLIISISVFPIPNLKAQEEKEEDEVGFFEDGINSKHFESNYEKYGNQSKINYEMEEVYEGSEENYRQNQKTYLNLDHDKQSNIETGENTYYQIENKGRYNSTDPQRNSINDNYENKRRNDYEEGLPDNPGDPDAPIDKGVWILLAVGLIYGIKRHGN